MPAVNIKRTIHPQEMNDQSNPPPEAWHLQMLKLLQANPGLSQRQLAAHMGVSLGKANYCLRALVEKGLVKLGNFGKNPNKRQYAYLVTPAGLEEKTRITLSFLKRKETEFDAIRKEIESLKGDLGVEVNSEP
jgi:EPS-associated MarR family transcriptional regulator